MKPHPCDLCQCGWTRFDHAYGEYKVRACAMFSLKTTYVEQEQRREAVNRSSGFRVTGLGFALLGAWLPLQVIRAADLSRWWMIEPGTALVIACYFLCKAFRSFPPRRGSARTMQ